jgi:hypothetical protein
VIVVAMIVNLGNLLARIWPEHGGRFCLASLKDSNFGTGSRPDAGSKLVPRRGGVVMPLLNESYPGARPDRGSEADRGVGQRRRPAWVWMLVFDGFLLVIFVIGLAIGLANPL